MIYKALEVIQIFLADGRTDRQANEGVPRGPRGPKNLSHDLPALKQLRLVTKDCIRIISELPEYNANFFNLPLSLSDIL